MKTVVILRSGRIEVYAIILDPEEAEEIAELVERKGLLETIIKPDYTVSLPD